MAATGWKEGNAMGRGRAWAVFATVLALAIAPGAPASATPRQASLADVLSALRTNDLPADYVVLLDVSSSMQSPVDLYTPARQALRPLLGALSPVDRLHLFAFADRPDPVFSGPVGDGGANALQRLPARADGAHTDIGAAIEAAIDIIDDPLTTDPATVVLLTDGVQDAPHGSRFAGDTGAAIASLRRRAEGVEHRRRVRALGIPLTGDTDVRLLDQVFDNTVLMDLPPEQVGGYLTGISNRIKVEKAAAYVAQDRLSVTVTAEHESITVRDKPMIATVRVHSDASRVPLTVTGITASVGGVALPAKVLSEEVTLDPAHPDQTVRIRIDPPSSTGFWIGGARSTSGTLRIQAAVDSPWREVITRDLALPFSPRPIETTVAVRASANGIPVWLVVLAGLILLILILLAVGARRRHWKSMSGGHLTVNEPGAGMPYRQMLSGRKVSFPAPHGTGTTAGSGTVRAVRQRRPGGGTGPRTELVLRIDYRRAGKRHRIVCRPRQTQPLNDGTTFSYQP